jgi:hypothetical protein
VIKGLYVSMSGYPKGIKTLVFWITFSPVGSTKSHLLYTVYEGSITQPRKHNRQKTSNIDNVPTTGSTETGKRQAAERVRSNRQETSSRKSEICYLFSSFFDEDDGGNCGNFDKIIPDYTASCTRKQHYSHYVAFCSVHVTSFLLCRNIFISFQTPSIFVINLE